MKKIIFIALTISLVSCNRSPEMKSENQDMAPMLELEDDFAKTVMTPEMLSVEKFEEFINLVELKQQHPEFKNDIDDQLKSYTTDSLALNYPLGFNISDIKQLGETITISDTTAQVILGFMIRTPSTQIKDSILVEISSKDVNLDGELYTSQKFKFLRFK